MVGALVLQLRPGGVGPFPLPRELGRRLLARDPQAPELLFGCRAQALLGAELLAQRIGRARQLGHARVEIAGETLAQLVDRGLQLRDDLEDRRLAPGRRRELLLQLGHAGALVRQRALGLLARRAFLRQAPGERRRRRGQLRPQSGDRVLDGGDLRGERGALGGHPRSELRVDLGRRLLQRRLRVVLELMTQRRDLRLARLQLAAQRGQLVLGGLRALQPLGDLRLDVGEQRRALLGGHKAGAQLVELAPGAGLRLGRSGLGLRA